MTVFRYALTAILILSCEISHGAIPLLFQADKNNIQILPQRFEYNLLDEDNIKIGDIVIDSTTFGFQVAASTTQAGAYRARFVWPSSLLKEGALLIKDQNGKAIWSTQISRRNIRLISSNKNTTGESPRTPLAELTVDNLDSALIEDMKFLPFMNFCIYRKTSDTRIYLCSKEVYLVNQDGKLAIRPRSQGRKTAFVEINGRSVGSQGTIFLNNPKENIGFRAATRSGAVLEVETRMKLVDFKDMVLSEDGKELIVTASGAEPVNEEKVQRLSAEDWKFPLNAERPILYLKGEGDIPMRQEFNIRGKLPSENLRPSVSDNSPPRIYNSDLKLSGTAAAGTRVSPGPGEQSVERLENNEFIWRIDKIAYGEITRHYLRVNSGENSFMAAYDIYREFPFEAGLRGNLWLPASQMYGSLFGMWWFENFLTSSAPWSRLHWGLNVEGALLLNKKDGELNPNITHIELLWRKEPGFHFMDKTWGLSLVYDQLQVDGVKMLGSPGFGAFYSAEAPKKWQNWFHWYDLKMNYLLGGTSSTFKMNSGVRVEGIAYYHFNNQASLTYGAGLNQYSFDQGSNKAQLELLFGGNLRF